ncbi:hypothetical protein BsWGS_06265 [Bradybaena similaris]
MSYSNTTTPPMMSQISEGTGEREQSILSMGDLHIFQIVNHVVLSGAVCLFGIAANVINMIVFFKQGFQDTVNLSLFAISLSDLFSLVTLEWVNINLNPFMDRADVPFEPVEVQYFTGGWPHACFARITIWLTVGVTAERLCCVVFPLKVKQMISPARMKVAICVIYVAMLVSLIPVYCSMYFGEKFVPTRNQTRVGLIDRDQKQFFENLNFELYAIIGISHFLILIVLTCLLITRLKQRSAWRRTFMNETQQEKALKTRERRTMKLVSLVAIMVIVCFTPTITLYFTMFFVPGFGLTGTLSTIFNAMWSISFLAEAINSSANIFIFYRMSSRYRQKFHEVSSMYQMCKHRKIVSARSSTARHSETHRPGEQSSETCHSSAATRGIGSGAPDARRSLKSCFS